MGIVLKNFYAKKARIIQFAAVAMIVILILPPTMTALQPKRTWMDFSALAQDQFDSMPVRRENALNALQNCNQSAARCGESLSSIFEILGPIMPIQQQTGNPLADATLAMMSHDTKQFLNEYLALLEDKMNNQGIPETLMGKAYRTKQSLASFFDVFVTVENFINQNGLVAQNVVAGTQQLPPDLTRDGLDTSTKTLTVEDPLGLVNPQGVPLFRLIWGPFWPPPHFFTDPEEDVIVTEPIASRECVTITKEKKGNLLIFVPVKLPIWVEPWTSRATIIGFVTVWVLWWIPAEFIKSINYCNQVVANRATVVRTIDQIIILEWPQAHFWWYF